MSEDGNGFAVRPYLAGDEKSITELFRAAFGRDITPEHWRWKLKAHDSAVQNVWLATQDGAAVFQYAAMEMRYRLAGRDAKVMVSVDTMTQPNSRRKGVLTRVAPEVYDSWGAQGATFALGLPNQQWGSRLTALGWQSLFPFQWLIRPLRPEAMLARHLRCAPLRHARIIGTLWNRGLRRRTPMHAHIDIEPVQRADAAFDDLWERCRDRTFVGGVRDRRWVQWRFLDCPSRHYHVILARRRGMPVGYAAYSINRSTRASVAHIAEIFTEGGDAAIHDTLLGDMFGSLLREDVDSVAALAIPGTPQFARLRRAGFRPRHSFTVYWHPLRIALPVDNFKNPLAWTLSGADFDVV